MTQYYENELQNNKNNFMCILENTVDSILSHDYNKDSHIESEDETDKAEEFYEYLANVGKKMYGNNTGRTELAKTITTN